MIQEDAAPQQGRDSTPRATSDDLAVLNQHIVLPSPKAIPPELCLLPQWVCWCYELRDGRPTKPPINPRINGTPQHAKSNDPATWTDFDTALTAARAHGLGIGFCFRENDGLAGIDLDHVLNPDTGEIDPKAAEIIERFKGTYCEISPSGTGLRIFCYGRPQRSGKNTGTPKWLESYAHPSSRFLTVTGNAWAGAANTITEQQAALDWLHEKYMVSTRGQDKRAPVGNSTSPSLDLDDAALLVKARGARNGTEFERLFAGDLSRYEGDESAADLALCNLLAFWTGKDAARMDRLFRQSGLMRSKWDERRGETTYGELTIGKAIAGMSETYSGRNGRPETAHTAGSAPVPSGSLPLDGKDSALLTGRGAADGDGPDKPGDWGDQLPLRREMPPSEPFPIDTLGDVLGAAVRAMMEVIQAPNALCANSLLAGAALAVQAHADVVIDGRTSPLSEFLIDVGETGERKSATDRAALAPHAKRQRDLQREYQDQIADYEADLAAWKKAREEALSAKKSKTREAKKAALRELGPEPQGPIDAILTTEEPSYEGLVKALAVGWPSMGLFSDEGGRFLGGHGMSDEHRLKTVAGLSKLWDGDPISRTRAGDGNFLLFGRRVSLHLMIQPVVSGLVFGNELLAGQGLMSRCLVSWPTSTIGSRPYREEDLALCPAMKRYFARLMDILEAPLPLAEDARNELKPRQLSLSREAKRIWIGFHDHIETLCREGRELFTIRGLACKAAEHAARRAGNLTLVRDINASAIARAELEAGIEMTQFYLGEALRLFNAAVENPDLVLAEKALAWARAKGGRFAMVELYQIGPNPIREKATAERILKILEDHGLARRLPEGTAVSGKDRKIAWEVRP